MAKVKHGGLVTGVSGTLGGFTWTFGGKTHTVRGNHIRTKRVTAPQLEMRSWKAYLADRWAHKLFEEQRKAWLELARRARRDIKWAARFGLSGAHLYVGGNLVRFKAELPVQDAAPSDLSVYGVVDESIVVLAPTTALIFFSPSPLASGHRLYIFARGPVHHGRVARLFDLRFLGVSPPGIASPFDVGPLIVAKFGLLAAGDWLSVFVAILRDDGGVRTTGVMLTFPQGQIGL